MISSTRLRLRPVSRTAMVGRAMWALSQLTLCQISVARGTRLRTAAATVMRSKYDRWLLTTTMP